MPIIDVQVVIKPRAALDPGVTQMLANSLGQALNAAAGHVWVRVHELTANHYAENGLAVEDPEFPVFVTVLHAHIPQGVALSGEAQAIANAVANSLDRPSECVHVEYAPAGAQRLAFGGKFASC